MEDGEAVAEPGAEAGDGLRGEADLGDEDDRPLAALQRRLDRGQVDLGLARAGDAVQQQAALGPGLAVERGDDRVDRLLLLGQQLGAARRGRRGAECAGARRRRELRVAIRSRSLQPPQGLAVGADRGGQLGARHLAGAQRLQHRPLLDPEAPAAAQRLLAGRQDLRPQLDLGADRAAAGAGARRQHQLQAARGGRAVLAGDPEAEPDQLRRGAGLERLDRLRQPLRRQLRGRGQLDHDAEQLARPEGDADDAADLEVLHRLRLAVVERAPQGAGGGQRLDPEDGHPVEGMAARGRPAASPGERRGEGICCPP